ncbi:MAG: hypothetical protein ACYTDU_11175 [Planctomycetota bacterium]|jgi:hypothetical protein
MKHIAIALALLAALAIEVRAQDLEDHAGTWAGHGLGIYRQASASVDAGPTPDAQLWMRLYPNVLGRCPKSSALNLNAHARGSSGAALTLRMYGVMIEDETGAHIDVDNPDARTSRSECFLAMVGAKLVSFDITVTVEMDLDLQVTARGRIWLLDPRGRIFRRLPACSHIDGTADATIIGSVRVYTPGAYAVYALKFFGGTLTAKNLAANEDDVLVRDGEGAWLEIDPVSMYLYLMAPPYRRFLARAAAPGRDVELEGCD